jgi:hypothetical protein
MAIAALTLSDSRTEAMSHAEPAECANLVVTSSSGHSQRCANPFCNAGIEPTIHGRWRRTQRRFCSDTCKYDYHDLKRVKALLKGLPKRKRISFSENRQSESRNKL